MEDTKYIVYLHISKITGEVYVGYTKNGDSPKKRWRNEHGYVNCLKFYNYIQKYGWDSFNHIILCYTSKDRALCIEHCLVKFYKRKNISLNILDGGNEGPSGMLGKHHTEETKKKIGEASKGHKMSEEQNRALDYYRHLKKGTVLSNEVIQKMRNASVNAKEVNYYNLCGVYLGHFVSTQQAARELNIDGSHIADVCNNKRISTGQYLFRYKSSEDTDNIMPPYPLYVLKYQSQEILFRNLQQISKYLNKSLNFVIRVYKFPEKYKYKYNIEITKYYEYCAIPPSAVTQYEEDNIVEKVVR